MVQKVAHILRRMSKKEWGGIETTVWHLSKEMEKRGIKSPIFTTSMLEHKGKEQNQAVSIRRFHYSLPWFFLKKEEKKAMVKKGGSPLSLSLLCALFFEKKIDLIHTHTLHRLGGIARFVARWRSIPYVCSLHGGYFTLGEMEKKAMERPFKKKIEWGKAFGWLFGSRRVVEDAAALITVGEEEYEKCLHSFPHKRIFYVPNGVVLDKFYEGIETKKRTKTVLCVSRIDPQKDQLLLIRAFAQFIRAYPEYTLRLIGPISDPRYYEELVAEIVKKKLEKSIELIDGYEPESKELIEAYQTADFFVLPSRHEPFGIVLLEAFAAKCPLIARRIGGIKGFCIDGENSLLFEKEEELFSHMCTLARDKELQEKIRTNGIETAKEYSWERVVDKLLAIYKIV